MQSQELPSPPIHTSSLRPSAGTVGKVSQDGPNFFESCTSTLSLLLLTSWSVEVYIVPNPKASQPLLARSLAPRGCYHVLRSHMFDSTMVCAVVNPVLLVEGVCGRGAEGVPVSGVGAPSRGHSVLLHRQRRSGSGG